MTLATQLIAPSGFGELRKGVIYYQIYTDQEAGRVVLTSFEDADRKAREGRLHYVALESFTKGLRAGRLKEVDAANRKKVPPWLSDYSGIHFDTADRFTKPRPDIDGKTIETPQDRVERRAAVISAAAMDYELIFGDVDPISAMNRYANQCDKNRQRFRTWLIVYLAFGKKKWALLPAPNGRGTYSRDDRPPNPETGFAVRLGRSSSHGREHGFDVTPEVRNTIVKSFESNAEIGMTLRAVYRRALISHFGCLTRVVQRAPKRRGRRESYHPQGKPFPSYGQYDYQLFKVLGEEQVYKYLLTEQEFRQKYQPHQGSFSQAVQDLAERVSYDASYSIAHPRSTLEGYVLQKQCIVQIICHLSAEVLGVSYTHGVEADRAYKQALFCMGIPKSLYARILGLKISDDDWPVRISPLALKHDGGAGSAASIKNLHKSLHSPVSHEMPPAYTPRGNAQSESTHDREKKMSGAPTYIISNQSPLQMAREHFLKLIAGNKSRDIRDRATPNELSRGIFTSHDLYADLKERGRLAGQILEVEELVTMYLQKVEFKVYKKALRFRGARYQPFDPDQRADFGRLLMKNEGKRLVGYGLDISTRVMWILLGGKMYEVEWVDRVRGSALENSMTMSEHEAYESMYASALTEIVSTRDAEVNNAEIELLNQTGQRSKKEIRKGTPKAKKGAAKQETSDAKL
ncbi:hypothetical protein HNP55_001707 [Paucibacter oligotrophus]|uniref:Uncharacterized protein n=1 Tax=Roseateles oligotrophus TaxID=1769250 RepID=A0A840LAG4_9BURK|nr:hypothetical protein [Roseateles oligotrophus]MBB4843188.1 hypothetical protein [Roseateles oligotrophus]